MNVILHSFSCLLAGVVFYKYMHYLYICLFRLCWLGVCQNGIDLYHNDNTNLQMNISTLQRITYYKSKKISHDMGWVRLVGSLKLCLFCKRDLSKRRYSAKETNHFKEPTNCSHPMITI